MGKNRKSILALCFVLSATAALFANCGGNPSSNSGYQGPGSYYTVSTLGSTYTFNKYTNAGAASPDFTVKATAVDVNGFKKFTVTSVTGTGGPTVGATVYGFEVPGMALFLKPLDASNPDQVLVAVQGGTCPSSAFNANWIKVKTTQNNLNQLSSDVFGTFTYTTNGSSQGAASLPAKFSLADPTTNCQSNGSGACAQVPFSSATCSNGIMRLVNGSDYITIYLTSIGAAIVDTSDNSNNADFIFGMPQPSGTFTTTAFSGTFSGLLYSASASVGSRLKTVKATLTAGSSTTLSGSGSQLTDVDNDVTGGGGVSLSLTTNSSYPGLLTGSLTTTGGTANVACVGVSNANGTGKQVLDCAGIDPGSTGLFNFLLVSR